MVLENIVGIKIKFMKDFGLMEKQNGNGIYYKNGKIIKGIWINGKFKNSNTANISFNKNNENQIHLSKNFSYELNGNTNYSFKLMKLNDNNNIYLFFS